MYIVINAPNGILSDRCSVVGIFRDKFDARAAMIEDIACAMDPEFDDMNDTCIGENHGTCYLNRDDSPEWHIFEI